MKQINPVTIIVTCCMLFSSVGCSDLENSNSSKETDEYSSVNEKQYGVKLNKVNLSRPVEGKNYSVDVSGLPISDEIESD